MLSNTKKEWFELALKEKKTWKKGEKYYSKSLKDSKISDIHQRTKGEVDPELKEKSGLKTQKIPSK